MNYTTGPWGIEQTPDMLWVGPMREDGHKVDEVVVGLTIGSDLTVTATLRQHWNAQLIAAAPELLEALRVVLDEGHSYESEGMARDYARALLARIDE